MLIFDLNWDPISTLCSISKQSDNDIQICMTENDNIIEKVQFSDVSTYLRCYSEKKLECGDRKVQYLHSLIEKS